jgi:hypothetical protein
MDFDFLEWDSIAGCFMSGRTSANPEDRRRRRLNDAELTPEQRAAADARRADRRTPEYQEVLARDIDALRREYLRPTVIPQTSLSRAPTRCESRENHSRCCDSWHASGWST